MHRAIQTRRLLALRYCLRRCPTFLLREFSPAPTTSAKVELQCWWEATHWGNLVMAKQHGHEGVRSIVPGEAVPPCWGWPGWAWVTGSLIAGLAFFHREAQCEVSRGEKLYGISPAAQAARLSSFNEWLHTEGGDTSGVGLAKSPEAPAAGLALLATEETRQRAGQRAWWDPRRWLTLITWRPPDVALATFPLSLTISARRALEDPKLSAAFSELLQTGVADERVVVMLFLLIERLKGRDSRWQPWLSLLPRTFTTPLFFGERELDELRGTTLYFANRVVRQQLETQWAELQPHAARLAKLAGIVEAPAMEHFLWAHAIFWSRAQSFPEPVEGKDGPTVMAQEGIVPGLDFCNHDPASVCRWTIWGSPGAKGAAGLPKEVALVVPRGRAPRPGQQLTINYGDKGNEELLQLYGFTIDANPHDVLMVRCPIPPPAQRARDPTLAARLRLLAARGLTPQIFLPGAALGDALTAPLRPRLWGGPRRGADAEFELPEGVAQTLECFVMEPAQLERELAAGGKLPAEGEGSDAAQLSQVERAGLQMAILTTFVRLLEVKWREMEGPEGTGPLEDDIQLLQDKALPPLFRSVVVYRAMQKRICRGYLDKAYSALEATMRHLQQLMDEEGGVPISKARKTPSLKPQNVKPYIP